MIGLMVVMVLVCVFSTFLLRVVFVHLQARALLIAYARVFTPAVIAGQGTHPAWFCGSSYWNHECHRNSGTHNWVPSFVARAWRNGGPGA